MSWCAQCVHRTSKDLFLTKKYIRIDLIELNWFLVRNQLSLQKCKKIAVTPAPKLSYKSSNWPPAMLSWKWTNMLCVVVTLLSASSWTFQIQLLFFPVTPGHTQTCTQTDQWHSDLTHALPPPRWSQFRQKRAGSVSSVQICTTGRCSRMHDKFHRILHANTEHRQSYGCRVWAGRELLLP